MTRFPSSVNDARQAAIAAGLSRYDPGVPCPQGHRCERFTGCNRCVDCNTIRRMAYRSKNSEVVREKARAYRAANRDKQTAQASAWQRRNPEKVKASQTKWKQENAAKVAQYQRDHAEKRNESNRRRRAERKATDPVYALSETLRATTGAAFRRFGYRKGTTTEQIVGCSWEDLRTHIERQFLRGMTWANRGTVWHVDHILPMAEAKERDELLARCHFTNLRPLWALDNHKKHAKRLHLI